MRTSYGIRAGRWVAGAGAAFAMLCAGGALCADTVETWSAGGVQGWQRSDLVTGRAQALSVENGVLRVGFAEQAVSFPELSWVRVGPESAGGGLVGDYVSRGVTNIGFRIRCPAVVPGSVRLSIRSGVDGGEWCFGVRGLETGVWQQVNVALNDAAGWTRCGAPAGVWFGAALRNVVSVGLRIKRNGDVGQVCLLDDFVINEAGAGVDRDGDRLSDAAERVAGTDAGDVQSTLLLVPAGWGAGDGAAGFGLTWQSVSGRVYFVERALELGRGFESYLGPLVATPPSNGCVVEGVDLPAGGPMYYRVRARLE